MPRSPLEKVRSICLSFPEAHEVETWDTPTFRVRNKLFAMYAASTDHKGADRPALWIKSTHVNQDFLVQSDRDRFFSPPYVGPSGWVGMFLDNKPDWKIFEELVRDAYCLTAPKKLVKAFETG